MSTNIHCNLPYEELSNEELDIIESRLYPNEYSFGGFLALDERLKIVHANDRDTLNEKGITYDQIADVLETFVGKYYRKSSLGRYDDIIDGKYKVDANQYKGVQTCPFQNSKLDNKTHFEYGSSDLIVTNIENNQKVQFGTLLPHLIRCHHFFEGPKSPYRVDPAYIIDFFDIKPNVDYTPKYKDLITWRLSESSSHISYTYEQLNVIFSAALVKYDTGNEGVYCLLMPKLNNCALQSMIKDMCNKHFSNQEFWKSYYLYKRADHVSFNQDIILHNYKDLRLYKILSDTEIDLKVNKQILKMQDFKDNNIVNDDMQLYVYNFNNKKYQFSIITNNIRFEYNDDDAYSVYRINKHTYIPLDDTDV